MWSVIPVRIVICVFEFQCRLIGLENYLCRLLWISLLDSHPLYEEMGVCWWLQIISWSGPQHIYSLPNQTAQLVAWIFSEWILRFRAPSFIQTESQGAIFVAKLMRELCLMMDIQKQHTLPYQPQSNSLAEKFNCVIWEQLSCFIEKHADSWDLYLPCIWSAYHTSIYKSHVPQIL